MTDLTDLPHKEQLAWEDTMVNHAYDKSEWIDARSELITFLKQDGKYASEATLRSYLNCCAEAVSGSSPLPLLSATMKELYALYGMQDALE
jgi:hypothetical protein